MASSSSSKYKHTVVPAALHHELSEYTNLLRVLRTNHIQDLSQHLLPTSPNTPKSPSNTTLPDPFGDSAIDENVKAKKQAELWTRWPLLSEDAPVPEWGFDDEIKSIALRALRDMRMPTSSSTNDLDPTNLKLDLDVEDELTLSLDAQLEPMLPYLVQSAYEALGGMLDEIAFQRPKTVRSMVNRFRPVRWQNVVEVARDRPLGFVDPAAVDGVEDQLSAIFRVESGGEVADEHTFVRHRRERDASPSEGTFAHRRKKTKVSYDPLCFMRLPRALPRKQPPVSLPNAAPVDPEEEEDDDDDDDDSEPTRPVTRSQGHLGRQKLARPEHSYMSQMRIKPARRSRAKR